MEQNKPTLAERESTFATQFSIVAQELGATIGTDYGHGCDLVFKDGVVLFARLDFKEHRYTISLSQGKNAHGLGVKDSINYDEGKAGTITSSISVSASKSPQAIAKDITRRLLPDAQLITARFLKRLADWDKDRDNKKAGVAALQSVCPGLTAPSWKSDQNEISGYIHETKEGIRADAKVCSEDIELNLRNLSRDQAVQVLKFLKTL